MLNETCIISKFACTCNSIYLFSKFTRVLVDGQFLKVVYCSHNLSLLFEHLELFLTLSFYWVEVCVRTFGVEDLVAVHDSYEVLGVGEIDDIMGITRKHDNGLDAVA